MYNVLLKDFELNNGNITVNYNKNFDYVDFFVVTSDQVDYIQLSDHIYAMVDGDANIIGGRVMNFTKNFSTNEFDNFIYTNFELIVKKIYKQVMHDLSS